MCTYIQVVPTGSPKSKFLESSEILFLFVIRGVGGHQVLLLPTGELQGATVVAGLQFFSY